MESEINPNTLYTDRELAVLLFKDKCKPLSWKSIQKMGRDGDIRGKQVGRGGWRFLGQAILDYLLKK